MRKLILALCALSMMGCASRSVQDKHKAKLHLRLGAAHIGNGNYPVALQELLKAEALDPEAPATQNNLGQVYFFRGRYDLAEKHLQRAVRLDPKYSEARNNLSRVLIEVGRYKEAETEIHKVIDDLTYGNPEKAYINLGLSKFNQKDYKTARDAFAKAMEAQTDDCIANAYFGRCYFEMADYEQATLALDRAIGFCQKNLFDEPHYYSALAYYRLGDKSKSITRFEELIKYYPNGKYRDKSRGMLSLIRKGH